MLILFTERRPRMVRGDQLRIVLLWTVPGVVAGVLILAALAKPTLQVAVGIAVIAAAIVQARGRTADTAAAGGGGPAWAAPVVGFTTGVLTTSTGTSGPPLVLWFQRLGFTPTEFRDTLSAAFLVLTAFGAVALATVGEGLDSPGTVSLLGLLILLVLGNRAGRLLFERLDPHTFRHVGLVLVVLAGIASVVAGLSAS